MDYEKLINKIETQKSSHIWISLFYYEICWTYTIFSMDINFFFVFRTSIWFYSNLIATHFLSFFHVMLMNSNWANSLSLLIQLNLDFYSSFSVQLFAVDFFCLLFSKFSTRNKIDFINFFLYFSDYVPSLPHVVWNSETFFYRPLLHFYAIKFVYDKI